MAAPAVDIRDAVVAAVIAAGISGITSSSVKSRKVAQRFETDPSPLCIVTLAGEETFPRTNMTVRGKYPVNVLLVRKGAATVAKSDNWMEEARRTLWETLYDHLLLGSDGIVRDCEYDSEPPFDRGKFDENDDVSAQLFTYFTEETTP